MFFVNQKLDVLSEQVADAMAYSSLSPNARLKVHDAFLKHRHLLEDYVRENPDHLPQEELDIILSWRNLVHGELYILKELKDYAVFLSAQTPPIAYGVKALSQPFHELVEPDLPTMIRTILLPFKGQIVYDGLILGFNVLLGPGIRRSLKDAFQEAKERHGIITSLPVSTSLARGKASRAKPARSRRRKTSSRPPNLDDLYPAVADFVRGRGYIEIGDKQGSGLVARALDDGGVVFESSEAKTLAGAMTVLEKALLSNAEGE